MQYLAAFDDEGNLTPLGEIMAEFPLDPQLSKMLIVSPEFRCSNEILTIAAMLSIPNVFLRPNFARQQADAARAEFAHPDGDHLTLLNVYHAYKTSECIYLQRLRTTKTNLLSRLTDCPDSSTASNWCWQNYLSHRALMQADNVRNQLQRTMERFDLDLVSTDFASKDYYTNIQRALACGFFMQVAHKEGGSKGSYTTIKDNQIVSPHPSSNLSHSPEYLLYHEFVLTTRNYIRTITEVRLEWLVEYAPSYYNTQNMEGEVKRQIQMLEQSRVKKDKKRKKGVKTE